MQRAFCAPKAPVFRPGADGRNIAGRGKGMPSKVEELFSRFRAPGLWQDIREFFHPRELECLQVEVTSCCMGRCVYCPHTTRADVWKSRHMSPETFAALWPVLCKTSRVHLQGWGEPFLNPYFMDFVSLARRAGCAVSTTTCGMRMDEELAERIVESGMDIVAFSLTGTDEAGNAARAGVPFARVEEAVRTAYEKGARIVMNPAPAASLTEDILRRLYVITPNQTETEFLTGIKVADMESAEEASELLRASGVRKVIITMGEKGAFLDDEGLCSMTKAFKVNAVDTTAAGDVYNGALCVGLAEGMALREALVFAAKASAISVTRNGAQPSVPSRSEVDEFFQP